jgi:hypothetical protein
MAMGRGSGAARTVRAAVSASPTDGNVVDLVEGDLSIEIDRGPGDALLCLWRGASTGRDPASLLLPYFEEVFALASGSDLGVEMHFEGLGHFNSSTVTTLIRVIQRARERRVRLKFVYDDSLKWQRLSFEALRAFAQAEGMFSLSTASGEP